MYKLIIKTMGQKADTGSKFDGLVTKELKGIVELASELSPEQLGVLINKLITIKNQKWGLDKNRNRDTIKL